MGDHSFRFHARLIQQEALVDLAQRVKLLPLSLDLPFQLVNVLIRLIHELLELLEALGVRTDLLSDLLDDMLPQRVLVEVVAMVDLSDFLSELVEATPCVLDVIWLR
jgi:hypothetical protein